MKYSRDLSRQYLDDQETLLRISDQQVKAIADTGATHVSIATPYDEEFLPVLEAWVAAARRYELKVWFRGNWSGWEEWFEHQPITREEHIDKTEAFIRDNPRLFEDGDYFSACPECENGGPGDPRQTGDVAGHRKFLIDEHTAMATAFKSIKKDVEFGMNSMNGDVAELVMDQPTTRALGGLIVVDHYVASPEVLNQDINRYARKSGGKVILGEFGAPIPDIHGSMSEQEQAEWLERTLQLLTLNPNLAGLNYWTSVGGTTALWSTEGKPKLGTLVLKKYYTPTAVTGKVKNTAGQAVVAELKTQTRQVSSVRNGEYSLLYTDPAEVVSVTAEGYHSQEVSVEQLISNSTITLSPTNPSLWYRLRQWLISLIQ